MLKKGVFSCMVYFSLCLPAARAQSYSFADISRQDGLSSASVSSIVQDSSGFIWFGTQNGLDRFDGTGFKIFTNEPFNAASLSENMIQTMYMDKGDVIWIGTYNGLDRFDTRTETFHVYLHSFDDDDSLSNNLVLSVFRDSHGSLWIGTIKGLNRLNETDGTFVKYLHNEQVPGSIAGDIIRALYEDAAGNLWIATQGGGLDCFNYNTRTFSHHRHDPENPRSIPSDNVMAVSADSDGRIWIATWDYGLSLYDPVSNTFENHRIPGASIYCLNTQTNGTVWIGSWDDGLFEYTVSTNTMTSYKHNRNNDGSLSHNNVYSLFTDNTGDLWIGTNGGGVNRIQKPSANYTVYRNEPDDPDSLSQGKVSAVLEDHAGNVWAGIYGGGVNRLNPGVKKIKHYIHDAADQSSISNDIINSIYEDSKHTVWFMTNEGLNKYVPGSDSFIHFSCPDDRAQILQRRPVVCMQEEPVTGNLWVATYMDGLVRLDVKKNTVRRYVSDLSDKTSLSDPFVTSLAYDQQGRLWVGTNNGLNRIEKDGTFRHYFHNTSDTSSIPSDLVRTLYCASDGVLWITFRTGGMARYDSVSDTFTSYGWKDGLSGTQTFSCLEDKSGNLWITTDKGLSVFNHQTGAFTEPAVQHELENNGFTTGRCRSASGLFYFGAEDGLYVIDPYRTEYTVTVYPLRITSFLVQNRERQTAQEIYETKELHVSYKENNVGFIFSALDFRHPGAGEYMYRLEGYDSTWIYCGHRNFAGYTNLPGGRYTFHVKGADNTGLYRFQDTSVLLTVSTPPWQRPWAIVMYFVAAVCCAVLIVYLKGRIDLSHKVEELTLLKHDLEDANRKLQHLSMCDSLTGIPNRRNLDEEYERIFQRAVREQQSLAALMLDIDHFKLYNDTYGHPEGDECLRKIAQVIHTSLARPFDFAARYGGEEFLILLPDTSLEGAFEVAGRILHNTENLHIRHRTSPVSRFVTVSIGAAAIIPEMGTKKDELIQKSDQALYRAKQAGRNRTAS